MAQSRYGGSSDNAWRRWNPYGKVPHVKGTAPALMEAGWLPRRAAAAEMDLSLSEFDRLVEERVIRYRRIGPGARLYEVTRV